MSGRLAKHHRHIVRGLLRLTCFESTPFSHDDEVRVTPHETETSTSSLPARVLVYCINYSPEMIGVGRYAGELGAYLEARGVEVEVVTTPPHYPKWTVQPPYKNRYKVERRGTTRITRCPLLLREKMGGLYRLLVALSFAMSSAPVLLWRTLRFRPQIIVATEPALFTAPATLVAAWLFRAKALLHVQDLEVEAAFAMSHLKGRRVQAVARRYDRWAHRGFDQLVTISDRMRHSLEERSGVPASKLSVIRNWVNLQSIYPKETDNAYRQEWGVRPGDRVVLYAGSIGAKQALHLVVSAARALQLQPHIRFVIAGEGPLKTALKAGAPDNVRFITLQPEHRLRDLLCAADLHILPQDPGAADLVLPSKLGGMLASGKPIIVQADPGTELYDFLEGAAILAPPGDAKALTRAIRDFTTDPPEFAARRRDLARSLSSDDALRRFGELLYTMTLMGERRTAGNDATRSTSSVRAGLPSAAEPPPHHSAG